MKATNIMSFREADQPFITFEADPRVAATFQSLGMLKADSSSGRRIWVLYPHFNRFDEALLTVMTYETEE